MVDLSRITTNGKALFLAYDQGLEHGPSDFDDENIDPNFILDIGVKGEYSAIIFQKGIAEKYYTQDLSAKIPLIVKLNGKTNLVDGEPFSPLLCSVEEAIDLGAYAVGYTVYLGSAHESEMTSQLARIVAKAHEKEIPVVAWMYPRGKAVEGKDENELAAYAARAGLELGADIVKLKYPGSIESMKHVVESAGLTKVVTSGGKKETEEEFLQMARDVMSAGAYGMAVGRNIWQHKDPLELTAKLKAIVFK